MFRGLRPDEIDVRVGSVTAKGVSLLLYKVARCDMNILDETYGAEFWQRDHRVIKDNLYGGVGIWNDKLQQWIWKWDCGSESFTEKEKGEASDSFKRACFSLGIGRELYTSGFIFVPCATKPKQGGRGHELVNSYQFSGAKVTDIQYRETESKREIIGLIIKDQYGKELFTKKGQAVNAKPVQEKQETSNEEKLINKLQLETLQSEIDRTGYKTIAICKGYKVNALTELTIRQWRNAMKTLEAVKNKKSIDLGL